MPAPALKLITSTLVAPVESGTASSGGGGQISLTNVPKLKVYGVFSSLYTNYYIRIQSIWTGSGLTPMYMTMMKSGFLNENALYYNQYLDANGSAVTGLRSGAVSRFQIGMASSNNQCETDMYIYSPFISTLSTSFMSEGANGFDSAYIRNHAGTLSTQDSYDGFMLWVDSASLTGKISVYGFNE